MSGSTIGGVVGGVIGFVVSGYNPQGFQIGWMIGSAVGGYVDPDVIQGPKLTDPQQQTATEGAPIPLLYGTCATLGTIIQCQSEPTEHPHKQRTGKGGPVQKTYTYTRTAAIAICRAAPLGGEMKLVRAWVNGKLAYDVSGNGKLDSESAKFLTGMKFYSGSETQMPDSDLEALPAIDGGGVGNVPAYRGLCYAVLPDCDVTQGGGALPVIKWEVTSSGTEQSSCDLYDIGLVAWWPLDDAVQGGTARELIAGRDGTYSDTSSIEQGVPLHPGAGASFKMTSIYDFMSAGYSGIFGANSRTAMTVQVWAQLDNNGLGSLDGGASMRNIATLWGDTLSGAVNWSIRLNGTNNLQPEGAFDGASFVTDPAPCVMGFPKLYTITWTEDGAVSFFEGATLIGTATAGPVTASQDVVAVGGYGFPASYGFIGSVSDLKVYDYVRSASQIAADAVGMSEVYSIPDVNGAYITRSGQIISACINYVTALDVDLADVVADLIERATISDYDVSALVGIPVHGYPILQPTSAGAALAELQKVYLFDLPEWGNSGDTYPKLRAVLRGGAEVFTLTDDDLVDVDDDQDTRAQQVERARVVNFIASDPAYNYDPIKQTSERASENIKADSEITLSTAVIFSRDEAAQRADIFQKIQWEEAAGSITRTVPEAFTQYVVSDTGIVDGRRYRIDAIDQQDGFSKWTLTRDRVKAYTSNATGSTGVAVPDPVASVIGPTMFQALNLTSLSSKDNVPGMYIFVCGLTSAWSGCDLYLESADGVDIGQLVATIIDPATMGWLTDALAIGGATLSVQLYRDDELDSVTDDQLAARMNAAAVTSDGVSEVLQFKTATDTGTKTYDLTDLTRAELDTVEADHALDADFALLDGSQYFLKLDASLAGKTLVFRPVSRGTVPADNITYSVVFDPPTFVIDGGEVT